MTAASPVLKQIAGLPKLSQDELKALWREYFGVEPPVYRRGFLVRGHRRLLQDRQAVPLADRLRQTGRCVRAEPRHLRLGDAVVLHDDLDGQVDVEHPAQLRPVRERTGGERIRDKFAASRRKGIFMGGHPPLGYDVRDRKLVVNPAEAELVRLIFRRFLDLT
jgi:hypothetical protein